MSEQVPEFVSCQHQGCVVSSSAAEYDSMTLRTGLPVCTKHVTKEIVDASVDRASAEIGRAQKVVIYYDIELSRDGEIEQLGAHASSGGVYSAFMRTSVRTNTSPVLRRIPPMVYAALARDPPDIYVRFIEWIKNQCFMATGSLDESSIILAAHYGSCHDHLYLVRSMLSWGIKPPNVVFSDTLALFKVVKGLSAPAGLSVLVAKYVPWISHEPHDAVSDAGALKSVVKFVFQDEAVALLTFGISCGDYMKRTGMNMYKPSPMVLYPGGETEKASEGGAGESGHHSGDEGASVESHL